MKLFAALLIFGAAVVIWASDRVTLQGERTLYGVECPEGRWEGWRCTGKLAAGERYRFRASKSRQEVIYWIANSSQASGKYRDCKVKDRDNWTCSTSADVPRAVTHEIMNGVPVGAETGPDVPFHAVRKWKWWMLRAGIRMFTRADY